MEKLIITKQNGKSKKTFIKEDIKIKQKNSIMNSLSLDKHLDIKDDIFNVNKYLKVGIKRLQTQTKDKDFYKKLYELFKSQNRNKEILNFFNILRVDFDKSNSVQINENNLKSINYLLINHPDILIKLISKIIIEKYFDLIISNLNDDELYSLYLKVLNQEDLSNFINIDEEYKEIITYTLINKITSNYQSRFKHLCWEGCNNLLDCDKIQDNLKGFIYDYKFIKDGYQIFSVKEKDDGKKYLKTDCMYVIKCDNYVKKKARTLK